MTMKNLRNNISAEKGEIVKDIKITNPTPTKQNNTSNFSSNQTVQVTFMDFYEETNSPRQGDTLTIPLSELVRLGYLQDKYYVKSDLYTKTQIDNNFYKKSETYSKSEIDAHVRLHYEVLSAKPNMTNKQWAASVRQANKQNYIFLIPFSTDYENDGDDQTDQEGYYIEYFYSIEDGDSTYATEKMERKGSTRINLKGYLQITNLDTELQNLAGASSSSHYKTLTNQVATNKTDIANLKTDKVNVSQSVANGILTTDSSKKVQVSSTITKNKISDFSHDHGNINNEGKMSLANGILITDANKLITAVSNISSSKVVHPSSLSSLQTNSNASFSTIVSAIDTAIGDLKLKTDNLELFELKSDLRADVWGSSGFLSLQDAETDSAKKAMKLGDYIYQHLYGNFYTKSEIDSKIASVNELQMQTLEIL